MFFNNISVLRFLRGIFVIRYGTSFMDWVLLMMSGVFEVVWSISMKYSDGLTRIAPSLITLLASICSFLLLAHALKTVPIGTAYAVWAGVGAVGTAIAGVIIFGEPVHLLRVVSILLIMAGLIGLRLS
jgi:quaternary ammonium compound-resistance protein SugE